MKSGSIWLHLFQTARVPAFAHGLARALAFFSVFRVMSEDLAAPVLSFAVYFAGLALLSTCFRESMHRALVRRCVWIILATYLFVWLVQAPLIGYIFWDYVAGPRA